MPAETATPEPPPAIVEPIVHIQAPTVGRVVLYTPLNPDPRKGFQVYPALVTHVWGPDCVNLNVQNDGSFHLATDELMPTSVPRAEKPGDAPGTWSWPPNAPRAAGPGAPTNLKTIVSILAKAAFTHGHLSEESADEIGDLLK